MSDSDIVDVTWHNFSHRPGLRLKSGGLHNSESKNRNKTYSTPSRLRASGPIRIFLRL